MANESSGFFSGDSFTAFGSLSHYLQFLHSVCPIQPIIRVNSSLRSKDYEQRNGTNVSFFQFNYVTVSLWLQNQIYMLVKQQRQGEI